MTNAALALATLLTISSAAAAPAAAQHEMGSGMGPSIYLFVAWVVLGGVIGLIAAWLTKTSARLGAVAGAFGALVGGFVGLVLIGPEITVHTPYVTSYSYLPTAACAAVGALVVALLVALSRKAKS